MVEEGKPAPEFELDERRGGTRSGSRISAASRSSSTSTPRTTRPAARRRPAGSATPGTSSSAPVRSCSGVSPDDERSHAKFREKFDLPFALLADTEHEAAEHYGVWKEKTYAGKTYMGVERSTFVIDADGNVANELRNVKPTPCRRRAGRSLVLTALPQQLADAIEVLVARAGGSVVAEVERLWPATAGTSARGQLGLAPRSRPTSPTARRRHTQPRPRSSGRSRSTDPTGNHGRSSTSGQAQAWPRGRRARRGRRSRS